MPPSWLLKLLHLLPPELAHSLALYGLDYCAKLKLTSKIWPLANEHQHKRVMGIDFPNPVGIAAGLDKNAQHIIGLNSLGFGFIEVGTLTPKAQYGNKKPRLFRLTKQSSLINRMGFNNKGIDYAIEQIKQLPATPVLGINIGKNNTSPNAQAHSDYIYCLDKAYNYADYITINISSPNTPYLRELQTAHYIARFLDMIKQEHEKLASIYNKYVPLVVKISPDMQLADLTNLAHVLLEYGIDGVITTNTTISRDSIDKNSAHISQLGGLSGHGLAGLSNATLDKLANIFQSKVAIIACGGISSAQDVTDRLNAGADLIQIYTSFIYQGPAILARLLNQ
jgi:dihydroorotate dehydrogenase